MTVTALDKDIELGIEYSVVCFDEIKGNWGNCNFQWSNGLDFISASINGVLFSIPVVNNKERYIDSVSETITSFCSAISKNTNK